MVSTLDDRGNEIGSACFGADGTPRLNSEGYASEKATWNRWGDQTEVSFFGTDGKPCKSHAGFAGFRSTFAHRGRESERLYVDIDGAQVGAREVVSYDANGNPTETHFFDAKGGATTNERGCAVEKRVYDDDGLVKEVQCLGLDGRPRG
jgi:hypothetical protein